MRHFKYIFEDADMGVVVATPELVEEIYHRFNKDYFGGKLPSDIAFKVTARYKSRWGTAGYKLSETTFENGHYVCKLIRPTHITVTSRYQMAMWALENTVLHEMVHIADYLYHPEHFDHIYKNGRWEIIDRNTGRRYDAHGDTFFMKEAQRLASYGRDVNKHVTSEENATSSVSDKLLVQRAKRQQQTKNRKQKIIKEIEDFYYTRDLVHEKSDLLRKVIANCTDDFTMPLRPRVVHLKELTVDFRPKEEGYNIDARVESRGNVVFIIPQTCLTQIRDNGFTEQYTQYYFESQMYEIWDLEDKLMNM